MMFFLRSNPSFFSLFICQFLGAFNDNLYKNAMIMFITFKLSQTPEQTGLLITLAAGLFILPFFVFSSFAGQLADRYPKSKLIQKIKLSEILVMLVGAVALMSQQLELLFFTLFLMGTQSAFFGPLKYSVLPELLEDNRLMKGNALFSSSTFIAILLGSILGGIGVLMDGGTEIMAVSVLVVAVLGYGASLGVKPTTVHNPALIIDKNLFKSTWQMIALCRDYKKPFFALLAISWFWFLGATLLSQIPTLVKYDLHADDVVVVTFLSLFSIGIGVGAALVTRWFKGEIHLKGHGLFLLGISLCFILMVWLITGYSERLNHSATSLMGLSTFLGIWPLNSILLLLFILAILGGAYIVPLYTLLQKQTPEPLRARMIAVNNIMNALFMVLSSVLIMIGYALSFSLMDMLVWLAILNGLIALYIHHFQKNKIGNNDEKGI
ncbi:Lysophospholipid transporter LplT / 2-acylglycerophosphoethanolamine acyltransferase [hydrothermal vent metagenome]|uniref:Lysophospholipid transporter LplT / 2-acylglycerophosphoethanolamine acyltransferase n=1 Tax=hydrothermal vent metagenome TaxID=652676 RepID=A0A3B0W372_9ZZZZ